MMLEDVAEFLIAMGVSSAAWPVWQGTLEDDIDQAISLFETPGWPPDTLGQENESVGLQLRVRGEKKNYAVTRQKWLDCFNALQEARQTNGSPILLPGFYFIKAQHFGPLMFYDDKGRPNFCTNYRVFKARSF
jgi:hypothetical protein